MGILIVSAIVFLFLVDLYFRKYGVLKDEFKRKTFKHKNKR